MGSLYRLPCRPAFVPAILIVVCGWLLPPVQIAGAGTLMNDPKGFHGIPWGSPLANVPDLTLVNSGEHISEYELKSGPSPLGKAKVDSMRFVAFDGEFARVTIRYNGKETHEQLLAYLQSQFGPIDRTPGSMMRGLNQQFNWRGAETEINMTFEARRERGFISIDSRNLAPKFNEFLPIADTSRPFSPSRFIDSPL